MWKGDIIGMIKHLYSEDGDFDEKLRKIIVLISDSTKNKLGCEISKDNGDLVKSNPGITKEGLV